ncbi:unnamed protein product, partial [marine sediment metagenome]
MKGERQLFILNNQLFAAGNHGCEIEDGAKVLLHPGTTGMKPVLKKISRALKKRFAG